MTKVNTGFGRYTKKRRWTCAFPGGLKSPTGPMYLEVSTPDGLIVWKKVWEQRGDGRGVMVEGL